MLKPGGKRYVSGLHIRQLLEPRPDAAQREKAPAMAAWLNRIPLYLYWVLEKNI